MNRPHVTRRNFLGTTAGALAAAPFFASTFAQDASPNERLQVASIGVGGMIGRHDLNNITGSPLVELVAMCDVDAKHLGEAAVVFPHAKTFQDYRRMFDALAADIDAVVISTPDHMHGPIALAAMSLGKHVYCQKPLAHNLYECRAMQQLADENNLITQMGTQGHSFAPYLTAVAAIRSGVIGKVREAHAWVGKTWDGPQEGRPATTDPVPEELNWDLWLGVAPERPFASKIYHPHEWRRWTDFGTGTLGDMGCHIFDPIFSALALSAPTKVTSRGPTCHPETFAPDSDVDYRFAGTQFTDGEFTFRWTDGTANSRPDASRAQLPPEVELPGGGSFMVGEKGVMVLPHIAMPKFYSKGEVLEVAIEELPQVNHYHQWADACRGIGEASTPFAYGCPVTEAVLTGTIASRFPDKELTWDSAQLAFDDSEANALIHRDYREGWILPGLTAQATAGAAS